MYVSLDFLTPGAHGGLQQYKRNNAWLPRLSLLL